MKQNRFWPFAVFSVFFALLMLLFTFLAWGWFSDGTGMKLYFEIPLGDRDNALAALSDLVWMSAPFTLLFALVLSLLGKEKIFSPVCAVLASFPLFLFSILKFISFLEEEKDGHFSVAITLVFLLLTSGLTLYASFFEEVKKFAAQLYLIHGGVEVILVILSFIFKEKISQFYFSQYLLFGHTSTFRYWYFLISVFLFYLCYSLSLFFRLSAGTPPEKRSPPPPPKDIEEDEEEESLPLSLEDLGLER